MPLDPLTADERAFCQWARGQDWPRTGVLLAIIERLSMRLQDDENAIAEARAACGERWQPGMTLAEAVLSIRSAR